MYWSADISTGSHQQQVAPVHITTDTLRAVPHNSEYHVGIARAAAKTAWQNHYLYLRVQQILCTEHKGAAARYLPIAPGPYSSAD